MRLFWLVFFWGGYGVGRKGLRINMILVPLFSLDDTSYFAKIEEIF